MPDSVIATPNLTKHPDETLVYAMEFSPLLDEGETLTGTPTVTVSPTGPTISAISRVGTTVTCRILGGTAELVYRVTFECGTSEANTRAAVGILEVQA